MLNELMLVSMAASPQVGKVTLPESLSAGSDTLNLSGAGMRTKLVLKLYACGLYLKSPSHDANQIINADESMGLRLHITSGMITSDKLSEAMNEGFLNATGGNTSAIQGEIDQLNSLLKDEIKENDTIDIIYVAGEGVKICRNGNEKGGIPGLAFKKALFGIWLGDKPADKGLKKSLLG